MAHYIHLEIYKKTYDFLVYYSHLFVYFQKEYRYTIGEKIMNSIIEFIILIYKANSSNRNDQRLDLLKKMDEKMQYINVSLRLANSLKSISNEKYLNCANFTFEIEKQLTGWICYTTKQIV